MNYLLLLTLLLSFNLFSQEYRHQVVFGNNYSVGLSSSGTSAKTDSDLGIEDFDVVNGELNLNYMYSISDRFQIGGVIFNDSSEVTIKNNTGDETKSESKNSGIYLLANFNFSERLNHSWYIGLGLGREFYEDKSTDTSGTVTKTEYDVNAFMIYGGRRISLDFMGIENLTYSPMVSIQSGKVGGDLEDSGVESITNVTFDILKLDLLF